MRRIPRTTAGRIRRTSVEIQSFTFDDKGSYKVEYDTELLSGDTDPQITEEKFFEKPLLAPLVSE